MRLWRQCSRSAAMRRNWSSRPGGEGRLRLLRFTCGEYPRDLSHLPTVAGLTLLPQRDSSAASLASER